MKKPSKYLNRKVEVDGLKFDSQKEAQRYGELKLLERSGKIRSLRCQVRFPLFVNEQKVCTYVSDFCYLVEPYAEQETVEDVKSEYTRKNPVYRLKRKMFRAQYGFDIVEV